MSVATPTPAYSVPPVARAFKLLRHIASGDAVANMSVTARALRISRTTLIRLMATLEAEQMIERTADGRGYKLGLGLAGLAGQALFTSDIVQVGEPVIQDLTDRLALSSHIGVLSGREVLYVARRTPNVHLVSNVGLGSRLPAHATTLGRIILAHLPRDRVMELFHGVPLKAATAKTPTTMAALTRQLDADFDYGVAWSDAHFEAGISSVAAVVFDRAGGVAGAINVTGPSASFTTHARRRAEIERAVRAGAAQISQQLGHTPTHKPDATRRARS